MTFQRPLFALAATAVITLTGCASSMNIGESGLTCPAGEGMPCTDSRTVFERTNNFQPGDSMYGARVRGEGGAGGAAVGNSPQPFDNFDVDMRGGVINHPLPVRTGAKVMRIWVNSWVDERGDLNYPSLLFTEITPRQWNVNESASKNMSPRRMTPLRVKEGASASPQTKPLQAKPAQAAAPVATTPAAPAAPAKPAPLLPAPLAN